MRDDVVDDWLTDERPAPPQRPVLLRVSERPASNNVGHQEVQRHLCERPVNNNVGHQEAYSAMPPPPKPKLLQRPKDSVERQEVIETPAPKTLKQKEAEYAAARARIFGQKDNGRPARDGFGQQGRGRGGGGDRGYGGGQQAARQGQGRGRGDEAQLGGRGGSQQARGGRGGPGVPRQQGAGGNNPGPGKKRSDDVDPDYDRNPELYAPRLSPDGPAVNDEEGLSQYQHVTYEAEFPVLGR
eukprot:gnl/TRDRNA2_/TRDRNA2_90738_c0_seq1.p1 gnl/TRDRNA2_/TRDRNA2_90738_c0~~gnl/TRDRNA2_/TRDRNA2_90738_c0_seq1.p1  ORF type:complete len:241 (+),score=39.14 gnl/TRDRNA2_/TRDRNA2_90738_c0_seq1:74-796(+)